MSDFRFVPKKMILYFHEILIKRYGGNPGLRDEALLDSALEQPRQTFDGKLLHGSIYHAAAAYGYHLCGNHPFIDGNKRIAFVTMDVFLQQNGLEIIASEKEAYEMMALLSNGDLSKEELTQWLEKHTRRGTET